MDCTKCGCSLDRLRIFGAMNYKF
uniref:Uncharacterized protein n=1 Tax=Arundo donax TaxID=35708 RepID=A0A0A8YJC0_ARUDO